MNLEHDIPFAVVALIRSGTKILATSRRDEAGQWGLPGGKIDTGEEPLEALIREVKEETNLDVLEAEFVFARNDKLGKVLCFLVSDWLGTPKQIEKGVDVKWVSPSDLIAGPFGHWNVQLFLNMNIPFNPNYTYQVAWSSSSNEYVGTCDQFPTLMSFDKDPDKAWNGIRTLVKEFGHG